MWGNRASKDSKAYLANRLVSKSQCSRIEHLFLQLIYIQQKKNQCFYRSTIEQYACTSSQKIKLLNTNGHKCNNQPVSINHSKEAAVLIADKGSYK